MNPKDAVDVNRAVNRLAAHVGLTGLRFVVGIGRLDPKHGGQIELERDRTEVFIDVSNRAAVFGPSLLGVLAHEVTHKALFDRRVLALDDDTLRYEILTDVTAAYLGFGKLLLNGYEYRSTRPGTSINSHEYHHVRFGYLSVEEVAFAHAMACRMRGVEPQATLRGLSPFAARTAVRVFGDPSIRAHIETAPQLVPRTTYVRRPEPSRPTPTRPRPVAEPHAPSTSPQPGRTPPASPAAAPVSSTFHLHERLLQLVYGDERQARRLVAFERERRQLSVEKSYEAAIERLIRDRC
ncbi:MAG: hypothetical protein LC667_08625 [Thioalkalivibrio sp.]|nr:hypothetical protein [Thioalkalivibrio sp.]